MYSLKILMKTYSNAGSEYFLLKHWALYNNLKTYKSKLIFWRIFPNQHNVFNLGGEWEQKNISISRVDAMSCVIIKHFRLFGIPQELHDFMLSFPWSQTIRKKYFKMFPLVLHVAHYFFFELFTERYEKISSWRNRVLLEEFFILQINFR